MKIVKQLQQEILEKFADLEFEPGKHIYRLNGKILPSVSTMLKQHYYPFDELKWAKIVAKKRNTTVNQILFEWKKKAKEAADRGTRVHQFGEDWWNDETIIPICSQERSMKDFLESIKKEGRYELVWRELQMFSPEFQYAGTPDLLLYDKWTDTLVPGDYKTNEKLDKSYGYLKYPFDYSEDSSYNKYQLQLSYYQIMIEESLSKKVSNRLLIWLPHGGGYEVRETNDFTENIKSFLKNAS